ncbi:MAG: tetratricopeptide repeat protein [Gammaproteobacteria bacterium]|nr:tetratricopeptide repeat protein [Gammaproteobacteria bacterium]
MRRIGELLRAGQLHAARAQLESVLARHPDYPEALRLLGGTQLALGEPATAETVLRRALALDPAWAPTLVTLAELLLAAGRTEEAEALLERAASGTPPMPRAALLLTRLYNDSGRPERALAIAAPLCASGQADSELVAQHVAALAALGRPAEAVALYRERIEADGTSAAVAHGLSLALQAAGEPAAAARVAAQALERAPASPALCLAHGRSLIATGEHAQAERALREAVRLEPRLSEAHSSLAQLVWLRTGDLGQATATLDTALRHHANDVTLWAAKAALLQGAGDARAAYGCLERWLQADGAAPALLVRGALAALEFEPAAAVRLAERALARAPDNRAARTVLAAALLGVGEAKGALPHCETLLARSPDDQYLIALETTAWRLLGDPRYAERCDYTRLVMPVQLEAPAPWGNLAEFLAALRASLERLHDPGGHALLFQSLRHGTETTQDLTRSADPLIQGLFRAFAAPIDAYLARIGHGNDPLRRRNAGRWRFNGSWSVRLRSSGFHTAHVHPRGWISSACYIELPAAPSPPTRAGFLSFGTPSFPTHPPLPSEHEVQPAEGMLVLFPSYFWHGTVPFHGGGTRLTVAFDAVPAGPG